MHYRWNFPAENLSFLHYHFLYSQRDMETKEAKTEHMMDRMRHAGVAFGDSNDNKELVLGRDPKPLRIMQQQAIRTYRWVERMNQPGQDAPDFFAAGTDYLTDDEVPETLLSVLRVQGIYASLEESDKAGVDVMLASCGMSGILSTKLDRQLGRSDNLEVWL